MSKLPEGASEPAPFFQDDTYIISESGPSPTGQNTDPVYGMPRELVTPTPARQVTIMGHTVDEAKLKAFLDLMAGASVTPTTVGGATVPPQASRAQGIAPNNLFGALQGLAVTKRQQEPKGQWRT